MTLNIGLERDELADRLGGGLPQGSLCLVEGGSGSGKSVLAQRLAYGVLAHDHRATYVSTEFTTPAFLEQMDQLGYPVLEAFAERRLLFAATRPMLGHRVGQADLLPRLLAARELVTQPVVFVDVFSSLVEPQLQAARRHRDGQPPGTDGTHGAHGDGRNLPGPDRFLEELIHTLKQINAAGTTLVLTVDPDDLAGAADVTTLTGAADVRLECKVERRGTNVDRFIVVRKFARAGASVGDVIRYRVEPGAGFIVEIKAVA